jgi:hypothetical protein
MSIDGKLVRAATLSINRLVKTSLALVRAARNQNRIAERDNLSHLPAPNLRFEVKGQS